MCFCFMVPRILKTSHQNEQIVTATESWAGKQKVFLNTYSCGLLVAFVFSFHIARLFITQHYIIQE